MLFNPKWNTPTDRKASLDDLIQWLGQQASDGYYHYTDTRNCLAAQYRRSLGQNYLKTFSFAIFPGPNLGSFTRQLESVAHNGEHTFGAALVRAKAMRANPVKRWLW